MLKCLTFLIFINFLTVKSKTYPLDNLGAFYDKVSRMEEEEPFADWVHSIDESADPCQNFYAFACGQYEKENKIKFDWLVKLNAAITMAEPYIEACMIDAIFDDTPTNSSSVQKMRYYRDLFITVKGASIPQSYKKLVADRISSLLPRISDHVFVHHCFGPNVRRNVQKLVDEIEYSVGQMIIEAKWLDSKTKNAALNKLALTEAFVGTMDSVYDASSLDKFYSELQIQQKDILFIMEQKIKVFNKKHIDYFHLVGISPTEINAFNILTANAVFILAGIMNSHNFNENQAAAINYGRIGTIIGHELFHSFDNNGIHFDGNGEEKNWWQPKSYAEFDRRAQCFVDQYGQQVDTKINEHVDGLLTLGENIADNSGLRASYKAYLRLLKQQTKLDVPGYRKFDHNQSFFIAYGTLWCFTGSKPAHKKMMQQSHAPFMFRVNVPLMNMPEFSNSFNCSLGSPMNPGDKCYLW